MSGKWTRPLVLCLFLSCAAARAQTGVPSPAPVVTPPESPTDALGRTTPRGTVLGFLKAARKGDFEAASEYLNTHLHGKAAADLAHQLFVVLDRRLPARLNALSDKPEGSLPFLTRPDEDLVGTITSESGNVDIVLERVTREPKSLVWLFSRTTLSAIPDLFDEVNNVSVESVVPAFLVQTKIGQISLFQLLAVFVGLPLVYFLTGLLNRVLSRGVGYLRRRLRPNADLPDTMILSRPVRLLILALTIRWELSRIILPLIARQFWSVTAVMFTIAGCLWLLILLNGWCEKVIIRRLTQRNKTGATSILRLARRTIDLLLIFLAVLIVLKHFGVNPTAALAGLGVGGIAVALAAQKTLENVIGGISIIFDQVVRAGDFLRLDAQGGAATLGTVEYVGLRSTRIRTLDRTLVSVPNGQLANVRLETFSARDKFCFRPVLSLRYDTTSAMLRSITEEIRELLASHSLGERDSVRVRFIGFGRSSLDIEVFAHFFARDWPHYLEIQQELLLQVMGIVEAAGTRMALPSQATYVATDLQGPTLPAVSGRRA